MSDAVIMEYLGFESKNQGREYTFRVRYAAQDVRNFTLSIPNEAFNSHRVRYQDAPDVCSGKLRRELTANGNIPSMTNFPVSDTELDDYKSMHAPKSAKSPYARKPQDDE
jgi:hypothetical protein